MKDPKEYFFCQQSLLSLHFYVHHQFTVYTEVQNLQSIYPRLFPTNNKVERRTLEDVRLGMEMKT